MNNFTTQLLTSDRPKAIKALGSLLRGELAAVETYGLAIDHFGTDAPPELAQCRDSHAQRVTLLRDRICQMGGIPDAHSGTWGRFVHIVERGAQLIGRKSALAALEEGEAIGLAAYTDRLDDFDDESRAMVELKLLPDQQATRDILRNLCL